MGGLKHFEDDARQDQIDALRREYEAFRDESDALRACLEDKGILGREQYLAQVHRRRFARTLRRHPSNSEDPSKQEASPIHEALHNLELFRNVTRCAGPEATRQSSCASRALRQGAQLLPRGFYAVGGSDGVKAVFNTVERFDMRCARWEPAPQMPTPRSNLAAVAHDGKLYTIGGTDGVKVTATVEVFHEECGKWRPCPPMPTARSGMAAAACSGHLYVVGGREGFRSLGVTERFNPVAQSWQPLPSMISPRRFLAAASLGGKLYALGGEDDFFNALRTAECFHCHEHGGCWLTLPAMPTRRKGLAAVALKGRIYAIGGSHAGTLPTSDGTLRMERAAVQPLGAVERYDPSTGLWESLAPLPTPRMFLAAVVLDGKLYAIGGSDGKQPLNCVECFDEASNSWETVLPMPTRRVFFAAAALSG